MKFKTTNKAINSGYSKVLRVGYGAMQGLLRHQEPIAYTCGVYGWNADLYSVNGLAICTGYRATGNIQIDYKLLDEYEKKATAILSNYNLKFDEQKQQINALLYEFVELVKNK